MQYACIYNLYMIIITANEIMLPDRSSFEQVHVCHRVRWLLCLMQSSWAVDRQG